MLCLRHQHAILFSTGRLQNTWWKECSLLTTFKCLCSDLLASKPCFACLSCSQRIANYWVQTPSCKLCKLYSFPSCNWKFSSAFWLPSNFDEKIRENESCKRPSFSNGFSAFISNRWINKSEMLRIGIQLWNRLKRPRSRQQRRLIPRFTWLRNNKTTNVYLFSEFKVSAVQEYPCESSHELTLQIGEVSLCSTSLAFSYCRHQINRSRENFFATCQVESWKMPKY